MPMETSCVIRIAAAVIIDATGALFAGAQTGHHRVYAAGVEPGETPEQALVRELKEELSIQIAMADLTYLGHFSDQTVNEPGYVVEADVYRVQGVNSVVTPAAEIAEIAWVNLKTPMTLPPAQLTQQQLLPLAAAF